jgi:NAD(P)-dependent dehydrogenase (short-subunit alcohol dehydrogenase family)
MPMASAIAGSLARRNGFVAYSSFSVDGSVDSFLARCASEDIARCVVFLASDEAGFITGSTLTVNGAQYLT